MSLTHSQPSKCVKEQKQGRNKSCEQAIKKTHKWISKYFEISERKTKHQQSTFNVQKSKKKLPLQMKGK